MELILCLLASSGLGTVLNQWLARLDYAGSSA